MSSIRTFVRALCRLLQPLVFALSMLVPRDDDLWVFTAGSDGKRFADNTKYLFLDCADRDVRAVWITSSRATRDAVQEQGYEAYHAGTLRGKITMLRAGVFFETHGPVWPAYTGRARIVHLTHGNYLKRMLADHIRDWPRPVEIAVELLFNRRRRFAVTGAGTPAENTQSMHKIPGDRLLVTGFPRNDVLRSPIDGERIGLNEEALEAVADSAARGPVLLYAPTYREAYGEQNGTPFSALDLGLDRLDRLLETHDAHLYVSSHPASSLMVDDELERISELDSGGDLYPFMRHADVLLTDYSGIFYDYLLLDRPVLFYAPDLEAYTLSRFEYIKGGASKEATHLDEAVKLRCSSCNNFSEGFTDVKHGIWRVSYG